jgi:HEAT repeat protein
LTYSAAPTIEAEAHGEFVWFYYEAGCGAQAVPRAQKALLAEQYGLRIQACDVLGKYGDASALEALNTLAETDPYKAEREVRTPSGMIAIEVYYPVRERCQAATGQLRLRKAAG